MINVDRLCEEFAKLAAISSPSLHEGEISSYLFKRFTVLGAQVTIDDAAAKVKGESGNLIARFAGTSPSTEPLLLSAHMDTVSPATDVVPVLKDGIFRSGGNTILGADDKSGIAQIIEAIESLQEQGLDYPPLEIVITVGEEIGLLGVKNLDFSQLKAKRGLVLDTSGVGTVAASGPGANKLRFVVHGVEAHAGIEPEQGISAIQVAAQALCQMKLGRIDSETTANIGVINGGQATNIIPKFVQVFGEARSFQVDKLQRQTEHMQQCFQTAAAQSGVELRGVHCQAKVEIDVKAEYPALNVVADAPVLQLLQQAAVMLDQKIEVGSSGGGSDANIFNQHGIVTANLASGMRQVHTTDEWISVADLASVCRLLQQFIRLC